MQIVQPPSWARPRGYSNGIVAEGKLVFISGQVGWNPEREFESLDFVDQSRQALANVVEVLREAGGVPGHIVRLTWYILDRSAYHARARELGVAYREVIGDHYPAMTMVEVAGLVDDGAQVEIEATAVIPFTA